MSSELKSDLAKAKKPVLLIGGGCQKYRKEFREFSNRIKIPAYATWNALDIVTSDLPYYAGVVGTYGGPGRNVGIQSTDFLLSIGSRISGRITGGNPPAFAAKSKRYHCDIDPDLLASLPGEHILCDAGEFMRGFGESELEFPAWVARCKGWAEKYDPVKPEHFQTFTHYGFVRRLSERLPANAIVVSDTGGNVIMMGHCFKSKAGQRLFTSNGNTAMGFAFCGALGAWFADPTRPVICLIGDGGFCMNSQELQTMVNYGAKVKTFILNNRCYGNTRLYQDSNGLRQLACGPDGYNPPDFTRVAVAYGVHSFTLDDYEDIPKALAIDAPIVVDVPHHDFYQYYPRISRWDQDLDDQDPPLPREEIEANRI